MSSSGRASDLSMLKFVVNYILSVCVVKMKDISK